VRGPIVNGGMVSCGMASLRPISVT